MSESTEKPTLYLETTIVSYLVARPSGDEIVRGHQQLTRQWWDKRRSAFTMYLSPTVIEEASAGDAGLAGQRLALIRDYPVLDLTPRVVELAEAYSLKLNLPKRAARDAAHLAFAAVYEVDYLLTWNCAHLANAAIRRRLRTIDAELGVWTPVICTPEELLYVSE